VAPPSQASFAAVQFSDTCRERRDFDQGPKNLASRPQALAQRTQSQWRGQNEAMIAWISRKIVETSQQTDFTTPIQILAPGAGTITRVVPRGGHDQSPIEDMPR
jgi:hypothetical protein